MFASSDLPLWTLFISTNSTHSPQYGGDTPTPEAESVTQLPSFYAFPADIEMAARLRDPAKRDHVLKKPMEEFPSVDHMTCFGRPLWRIYATMGPG